MMERNEFIQLVQVALLTNVEGKMATDEEVLLAIRAIFTTLSEVLHPQQSQQLASILPTAIGSYLTQATASKPQSLNDFFSCVAQREKTSLPRAIHHSRTVIAVLQTAVSPDIWQKVWKELPHEFELLCQQNGIVENIQDFSEPQRFMTTHRRANPDRYY